LVAAYCAKDKTNSTSTVCLIGAGVTAGLLFVHALFDTRRSAVPVLSAPSSSDVQSRLVAEALEKLRSAEALEKANEIAQARFDWEKLEAIRRPRA
jgi:hypothetical protein